MANVYCLGIVLQFRYVQYSIYNISYFNMNSIILLFVCRFTDTNIFHGFLVLCNFYCMLIE